MQRALPRPAAVGGAVYAARVACAVWMAERRHQQHRGVPRIDQYAPDLSRVLKANPLPRAPGVD